MRYQSVIDVNNKNNSHTIAIDFVAEKAGDQKLRILDVGCSAGYLGEYFKTLGHHVIGIDMNAEAIEVARGYLDEVYCESLDTFFARTFVHKFDVVIFGDVLEHVTNSEEILKKTAQHLSPTGFVVASIPNVSHLAVRAMLLEGRWEYSDLGLLDRDHFRFFTKENIQKLFIDANYDIQDMKSVHLDVETVNQICAMRLNPKYVKYAKIVVGQEQSADIFQYVTLALPSKGTPESVRVVAYVPSEVDSLVQIRIRGPLENWQKNHNGALRIRDFRDVRHEDLYWGDVFVFQRLSSINILALIDALKKLGKKVVFEIDDLLLEIPQFLKHQEMSATDLKHLLAAISSANAVSTTTERLASKLREHNSQVYLAPNCIDATVMPQSPSISSGSLRASIVVASSDAVAVDMVISPLQKIKAAYGDAVQIIVIGPIAKAFKKKNIPVIAYPVQGYADFKRLLSELANPIGIIPLDSSVFSSCKSPIKFFDYASAGIPSLCSNVPPYSDYLSDGETGLLIENNEQAWFDAISKAVEDAKLRESLVAKARQYAIETHQMDKAGAAWQKIIEGLSVQRVHAIELLRPDAVRPTLNERIKFFLGQLLRYQIYINAIKVLFREGPKGIFWRLRRL